MSTSVPPPLLLDTSASCCCLEHLDRGRPPRRREGRLDDEETEMSSLHHLHDHPRNPSYSHRNHHGSSGGDQEYQGHPISEGAGGGGGGRRRQRSHNHHTSQAGVHTLQNPPTPVIIAPDVLLMRSFYHEKVEHIDRLLSELSLNT